MAYKYELYEECVRFSQEVAKNSSKYESSTINFVALVHGKARYYIYKQNLLAVNKIPKHSPEYYEKGRVYSEDADQAIRLLGLALDKNIIDSEGSRLLDMVMMLALSGSCTLKCKPRCLLCRSNKKKLAQSHICPRAILEDLGEGHDTKARGRHFIHYWPSQSGLVSKLVSAGQISLKLLCPDCELILSKSESKFLPDFFRKFYDRIEFEQYIEYDEWLYQFCISLIFRGMAFQFSSGRNDYMNEDEVYSVFVQCRQALLNSKYGPQACLFITPTATTDANESGASVNSVIHCPFLYCLCDGKYAYANHQMLSRALSYIFKIGMIITSVNFTMSEWKPDESSIISPGRGTFRVLPNEIRRQAIPDDLWGMLLHEALNFEKEIVEQPRSLPLQDFYTFDTPPSSSHMTKRSILPYQPKILNFVPTMISISHPHDLKIPTGKLELPNRHKVLVHLTLPHNGLQAGSTAFIVEGEGPGFGSNKPYLIFHQYEPRLQKNYAFFFSPSTFEFDSYLPDRTPRRFQEDESRDVKKMSKDIISRILKKKGFRNYHSLQYWKDAKR